MTWSYLRTSAIIDTLCAADDAAVITPATYISCQQQQQQVNNSVLLSMLHLFAATLNNTPVPDSERLCMYSNTMPNTFGNATFLRHHLGVPPLQQLLVQGIASAALLAAVAVVEQQPFQVFE
jgi:hypothetical protein